MWGALVVFVSVLLAIIGQVLVQRLVPLPTRRSSTAATGAIYEALCAMFGVSLAFSLFLVSNAFRDAERTVESEAGNLQDIYREAGQLPKPEGDRIRELAESYARVVEEEEWPLIGRGQESQPSPQAETPSEELEESIEGFEPGTNREQAIHTQLITLADDLGDDRELRLLESRQGVPPILWTILVIGGILTVALPSSSGWSLPGSTGWP